MDVKDFLVPSARRTPRSRVCWVLTAEPVAVEVGWGMVSAQTFAVALAHFGQDVDPVAGLHAVVGLDVESSLWLDDLEHLEHGEENDKSERHVHAFGRSSGPEGTHVFHFERLLFQPLHSQDVFYRNAAESSLTWMWQVLQVRSRKQVHLENSLKL